MAAVLNLAPAVRIDQRVRLHGVSWQDFEALLAMRGDNGAVRVSYLEGELELMAPSIDHENLKTRLARLLEAYAEERGIELEGFGSWTLKTEALARGAEADEC
jgi:Uma2 family endonuclease